MANPSQSHETLPPGHVPMPVILTGSMGLALASGLHLLGLLEPLDHAMAATVSRAPDALRPAIPGIVLWLATAAIAYGLATVLLEVPGNWRRLVIWTTTLIVIAAWLPVTAIAHRHTPIAAPLVAAIWSGLCTIIYAARHHMQADDDVDPAMRTPNHKPSDDAAD